MGATGLHRGRRRAILTFYQLVKKLLNREMLKAQEVIDFWLMIKESYVNSFGYAAPTDLVQLFQTRLEEHVQSLRMQLQNNSKEIPPFSVMGPRTRKFEQTVKNNT